MRCEFYMRWDIYARANDVKFNKFCRNHVGVGFEVFFETVVFMRKNEGEPVDFDDAVDNLVTTTRLGEDEIRQALHDACSEEYKLFKTTKEGKLYSLRVQRDVKEGQELSEKRKAAIKKRWNDLQTKANNDKDIEMNNKSNTNEIQMNNNCNTTSTSTSTSTSELSCSNEQSNSLKGSSFHSEPTISPEPNSSLKASGEDYGALEVVFEELPVLGGGTFKVSESQVNKWQESFPAIDVKEQIKIAHSWLDANPKNQKRDVKRFLNNWLMRNQDRARANSKAPVQETIKGTNIPMTLRANGGDSNHFANDHKYDDFFDPISRSKKTEVAK